MEHQAADKTEHYCTCGGYMLTTGGCAVEWPWVGEGTPPPPGAEAAYAARYPEPRYAAERRRYGHPQPSAND